MPNFKISVKVVNNGGVPVTAHLGASLVGATDHVEYYNESDDVKKVFPPGETFVTRYLSSSLGAFQKYYLYVALWEAEKPIGTGIKYAGAVVPNAVEKKKKKVIKLSVSVSDYYPKSFIGD